MSRVISEAMDCTEEEGQKEEAAEMRLQLSQHGKKEVLLTVEYCNDAWHLVIETARHALEKSFEQELR